MARLVLPIAGAAIGFATGIPGAAQWGWMIGGLANGLLPTKKSVKISETGGQSTAEGAPRAIVYGTALVTGNLIDAGPIRKTDSTETAKGGGPSTTTTTYTRTYAIRVCEGPIDGIVMVKQDGAVVYDVRTGNNFSADNLAFLERCTFYLGDEAQMPDASLEAVHGVGEVPAYRGSAYVVFADDDLTARQGSVPQYEFVVGNGSLNAREQTLTAVTASNGIGIAGSGLFSTTTSLIETMDDPVLGSGSAYLAIFDFSSSDPSDLPVDIGYAVIVGGVSVFSGNITLSSVPVRARAQLSISGHDSTTVELLFTPESPFDGAYSMRLAAITSGAYSSQSDDALTPDNLLFGVVLDGSGNPFYADYVFASEHLWGQANSYVSQGTEVAEGIWLDEIITDIHNRCGADVADVEQLTDRVQGLVLGSADYSGADAINTLRGPYFFDRAEVDGELVYVKRGAAVAATLTIDDLVAEPDQVERQAQIEYPRKLHLSFQSLPQNYEVAQSTSARYSVDVRVIGEQSLQVPVVLSEEEAAQIAAKLHKVAWADAEGEVRFSVPMDFIRLVPTDCIALTLRGLTRRLRIERIEDADGIRTLVCMIDRQSAYTSAATSDVLPTPTAPVSRVPGDTELAIMDMPAIDDSHDRLLYYVAVSGERVGWRGAVVQRSLDDGASFTTVDTLASASIMGELTATMAEASEYYTDTTNRAAVQLYRTTQTIESISETAFLSRGGAFAVEKASGGWEIMQYRDANDDGDGAYTLSVLHRGLLSSGPSAHTVGQRVVFLPPGLVTNAQVAWIGADLVHRGVSNGTSPEDAAEQTAEFVGRSQLEWPVASLTVTVSDSDASYLSVSLLLHGDGTNGSTTITDSSSSPRTITCFGNAQISTAESKFGGASLYFDGTGDWMRAPQSADFQVFGGNCTIELFANYASSAGNQCIWQMDSAGTGTNRAALSLLAGDVVFYTEAGGSAGTRITATAPAAGAWRHIALVRSGSTITLYLDGVAFGTTTTSVLPTGDLYFSLGSTANVTGGTQYFSGYIDEVRVTKGVARYTSNFTPTTEPFEEEGAVLTGTWAPRHRFGTDIFPIASLNHSGYRVTLDDGITTDTFDQTETEFTYDAAAMVSPVTVTVAPLNRYTGAGPSESVEVTL